MVSHSGFAYRGTVAAEMDLIRARLNAALDRAGMTQREVAARVGMSQSALSQMLSGKRGIEVEEFLRFCRAVVAEPCDMLGAKPFVSLPEEKLELLRVWDSLDWFQRRAVLALARTLFEAPVPTTPQGPRGERRRATDAPRPRKP